MGELGLKGFISVYSTSIPALLYHINNYYY